jgi:Zn-finger protein
MCLPGLPGPIQKTHEVIVMSLEEKKAHFFSHQGCEYFPCHATDSPQDFNCLFCFCPLYTLVDRCGGGFSYTAKGVKNCMDCPFPHRRENYEAVINRFPELAEAARRKG